MGMQRVNEIIKNSIDYSSIVHRNNLKEDYSMVYSSIDKSIMKNDNSSPAQYRQRAIAEKLLKTLGEPKSWKFYLKCAYHLSEDRIWTLVELAMKPNVIHHNRYFVRLALNEMNK